MIGDDLGVDEREREDPRLDDTVGGNLERDAIVLYRREKVSFVSRKEKNKPRDLR